APSDPVPPSAPAGPLERWFRIAERGSTVRTEVVAGVVTFLTMAYILFVNPAILGAVEDADGRTLPFDEVLTVTALVAGLLTIAMGVVANYPFAMAAGLGLNAFVAFTLVGTLGLTWPEAMGVIVAEGLLIALLVLTGLRRAILEAIPLGLKLAIGIGIGLFLAFIGLVNAGVVVSPEGGGTVVAIAPDLASWRMGVFAAGLVITAALVTARVRGALLLGIVATTALAIAVNALFGDGDLWSAAGPGVAQMPDQVVALPTFDLVGDFSFDFIATLGAATAIAAVLSVMLSDFFDTMGTVVAVGGEARLLDDQGRLPGVGRVLFIDSLGAAAGGAASASSNTTYIESTAGVSEGGRTGLTSVVVGVLFLLALFFSPLAGVIPPEATAPVLVIVGYFLLQTTTGIDWSDPGIGIPALLTITVMPFTFSITNGVGAGILSFTLIALLRGRWRSVHPLMLVTAAIFAWYFVDGISPG
ncbi:MAG TPA: NCS2 family permease, partial [Miltoncostaeaceae bacterium]|nr:NCS2 family permease [Miltoncostaeaceae bacterium]